MKKVIAFFIVMLLSVSCFAGAVERENTKQWIKKGTVTGSLLTKNGVTRNFTLTTDGETTRYDVTFPGGEYEDYTMLTDRNGRKISIPSIEGFVIDNVNLRNGIHSILTAGLGDNREAILENGRPSEVRDSKTVWTYNTWSPSFEPSALVLKPFIGDTVEYHIPGSTVIYDETDELPTTDLLALRLAKPEKSNCATTAVQAVAAILGKTLPANVDLSTLVDDEGRTKLADVVSVLRQAGVVVIPASLNLNKLAENEIAVVYLPGKTHLVTVTKSGYVIDMTSRRFLLKADSAQVKRLFDTNTALIASTSAITSHVASTVNLSNLMAAHTERFVDSECNDFIQPTMYHACNYWLHDDCYGDADWGIMYERWRCGSGVGVCQQGNMVGIEFGDCYEHMTYGCIPDWSTAYQIGVDACR